MTRSLEIEALRAEYELLCREQGVPPSTHVEFDETLKALSTASQDPENRPAARHSTQALHLAKVLGRGVRTRKQIEVHAAFPVGYGARVAGYMEAILSAYEERRVILPCAVYLDELPIASFNGRAVPSQSGTGALCLLDRGLFRVLHHVCLAAYLMANPDDDGLSDTPYKSHTNLRQRSVEVVRRTMGEYLLNKSHPLIVPEAGWLDAWGLVGACELSYSLKLFALAHELAHVRLGHLERLSSTMKAEERWEMEFEADRDAQETLCAIELQRGVPFPVVGGGFGFLLVDLMRHQVFRDLHEIRPEVTSRAGSHPPSIQRIKRLDDSLDGYFENRTREALAPIKLLQWITIDLEASGRRT